MRRVRRLLTGVLTALAFAMPAVPATSAQVDGHAWWWRPQTGLLGVELPAPPDVPADGLYVERGPDGASAISALRFTLAEGEADPVLTLDVASEQGADAAAIVACVTTTRWQEARGGRWDAAPGFDCEAGRVEGVRADDGSAWTWPLADLLRADGTLDVVLVEAAPTAFRVAFDAPTDASLATVVVQQDSPADADVPMDPSGPEPPSPAPAAVTPITVPQVPPPAAVASVPAPPRVADATTPAPSTPASAGEAQEPVAAPPVGDGRPSWAAYLLLAMIAGLVGSDLWAAMRARGGAGAPGTGGIGRFARTRTEPPPPLW